MARQNFGFGGGANMQQLMRQAQKMQQAMTDAQEKLDAQEYEAQSGGGVVSLPLSGSSEQPVSSIKAASPAANAILRFKKSLLLESLPASSTLAST